MKVKEGSWHYQLAHLGGFREWRGGVNLCNYVWNMAAGLLCCLIMVTVGSILGFTVIDTLMAAWFWQQPHPLTMAIWVVVAALVVFGIYLYMHKLLLTLPNGDPDSTAQLAFAYVRSVAGRYCVPIEIVTDKDPSP